MTGLSALFIRLPTCSVGNLYFFLVQAQGYDGFVVVGCCPTHSLLILDRGPVEEEEGEQVGGPSFFHFLEQSPSRSIDPLFCFSPDPPPCSSSCWGEERVSDDNGRAARPRLGWMHDAVARGLDWGMKKKRRQLHSPMS